MFITLFSAKKHTANRMKTYRFLYCKRCKCDVTKTTQKCNKSCAFARAGNVTYLHWQKPCNFNALTAFDASKIQVSAHQTEKLKHQRDKKSIRK